MTPEELRRLNADRDLVVAMNKAYDNRPAPVPPAPLPAVAPTLKQALDEMLRKYQEKAGGDFFIDLTRLVVAASQAGRASAQGPLIMCGKCNKIFDHKCQQGE